MIVLKVFTNAAKARLQTFPHGESKELPHAQEYSLSECSTDATSSDDGEDDSEIETYLLKQKKRRCWKRPATSRSCGQANILNTKNSRTSKASNYNKYDELLDKQSPESKR